jgi:hypothetical protein
MPVESRTSWLTWAVVLAIWLVTVAALAGPLFPFTPRLSDIAGAVALAPDLDVYLREREAQQPDVKPEQAKAIVWTEPAARSRTPLALVYIHGFSASRRDITPVVETLAARFAPMPFSPASPLTAARARRDSPPSRRRIGSTTRAKRWPSAAGSASAWC